MILADSEVALLKLALHRWEWFGYVSTAVVGLGCLGEFIAEFTSLPKSDRCRHKIAKLSLLVLILGIAGELLSAARTSQLSGQLIANIEERAGNAQQKAGEANERARNVESANVRLRTDLERSTAKSRAKQTELEKAQRKTAEAQKEAAVAQLKLRKYLDTVAERQADRTLNSRKFIETLKGKPKARVALLYIPNDSGGWTLAREIYWWLGIGPSKDNSGAGWDVSSPKPIPPNTGTLTLGEFADAPPAMRFDGAYSESGLTFIAKKPFMPGTALEALNMALVVDISPRAGSSMYVEDPSLPDDLIVLVVGSKPTWWWGLEKPGKP